MTQKDKDDALQEIMTVLEASQAAFTRLAGMSLFAMLR